jgi:hypothetical protein
VGVPTATTASSDHGDDVLRAQLRKRHVADVGLQPRAGHLPVLTLGRRHDRAGQDIVDPPVEPLGSGPVTADIGRALVALASKLAQLLAHVCLVLAVDLLPQLLA